jgi:hypothetical protein
VNRMDRIGIVVLGALCVAGVAACHHAKDINDIALTRLLRTERSIPNDPQAPIDAGAAECLRAWSGDAELAKTVPPVAASDAAKATCRQKIDRWIADAARNPDKIAFSDLAAPETVRKVAALLNQHRLARLPAGNDRPPSALMQPGAPGQPMQPVQPATPADFETAKTAVKALEALCDQSKQQSAAGSNAPLARYAMYCDKRIERLSSRITDLQTTGANTRQVQMLTESVQRLLEIGHRMANGTPPAQAPNPPAKH